MTTNPTPCSLPSPCEDGELCDRHERESSHVEGNHELCGSGCAATAAPLSPEYEAETVALRAAETERNDLRKRVVKPNAERMTIKAAAANVIDEHRDDADLATRITDEITTALNEVRGGVR